MEMRGKLMDGTVALSPTSFIFTALQRNSKHSVQKQDRRRRKAH
jgi:hypothetical protein